MSFVHHSRIVPEPFCIISTDGCQENPNKLFLGGVPSQATEKQLEEFFTQFGVVKDVRIVTDRITAECKGYGFVTFDENEDIEHLVERKSIRMAGKKIRIRKAIRRNGSQFDHIHTLKTSNNTNNNETSRSLLPLREDTSTPIIIPNQTYQAAETYATEAYHVKPVYVPLTPPESPMLMYESTNISNFSPSQMFMSTIPEVEVHNQQQNGLLMSPPWVQHNYPVIYVPSMTYANTNPNWFQY